MIKKGLFAIIACCSFTMFIKAQIYNDATYSLKTENIEEVIINEKDYEKVEYSYGLKQEANIRLSTIPKFEMGLKFKNNFNQNGRVNSVVLYLHKTEEERALTNLEITFHEIDSVSGLPSKLINQKKIIYQPKNRSRKKVILNVLKDQILFPENGAFVAIKWLPLESGQTKVGPSIRLTQFDKPLTATRFNNGEWTLDKTRALRENKYSNMMVGIEVYYRKRKN